MPGEQLGDPHFLLKKTSRREVLGLGAVAAAAALGLKVHTSPGASIEEKLHSSFREFDDFRGFLNSLSTRFTDKVTLNIEDDLIGKPVDEDIRLITIVGLGTNTRDTSMPAQTSLKTVIARQHIPSVGSPEIPIEEILSAQRPQKSGEKPLAPNQFYGRVVYGYTYPTSPEREQDVQIKKSVIRGGHEEDKMYSKWLEIVLKRNGKEWETAYLSLNYADVRKVTQK